MKVWAIIVLSTLTVTLGLAVCLLAYLCAALHPPPDMNMADYAADVNSDVLRLLLIGGAIYVTLCGATVFYGRKPRG